MPAISMTEEDIKVEQHIHSDECYKISCNNESEEHVHSDDCYSLACSESGNYLQLLSTENDEENQEEPDVPIIDSDLSVTAEIVSLESEDEEADEYNDEIVLYNDSISILSDEIETYAESESGHDGIVVLPDSNITINPKATVTGKTSDNNGHDIYAVQFNMTYKINQQYVMDNFGKTDGKYDSFAFNMDFDETKWDMSKLYNTNGVVYSGSREAGTFVIDDSGNVTITFYEDFINDAVSQESEISGTFNFKANLSRLENEEENEGVDIGGVDVEVPVYTYNHKPDIGVAKSVSKNYDISTYKAEYKIVVSSTNGTNDKVTITDTLSSNDDMTFDFENGSPVTLTKMPSGEQITKTVSVNENQAVISDLPALKQGESYEWICPVKVKNDKLDDVKNKPEKNAIYSNNAVVVSDGKLTANANASINQTIKANISKDGVYDAETDKIRWTVTVTNPGGINLGGYTVSDNLSVTDCSINPDGKGSFDANGTYTFGEGANEKSYTITYYTDASQEHGNNVKNTANLENPGGGKIKAEKTVNVPKQQTVDKTVGKYNGSEVEWTIKINNPYGRDLKDFTVVDEAFKELNDNPFSNYGTLDGDTLTFNKSITDKTITLTYKTNVSDKKGETIINDATLKERDIVVDTGNTNFHVPEHNQGLSKYGNLVVNSDGTAYIRWVVHVSNQYGASLKDYSVTDEKFNNTVKLYEDADGTQTVNGGNLDGKTYKFPDVNGKDYYIIYNETVTLNNNNKQWITNKAGDSDGNGTPDVGVEVPDNFQSIDSKTAVFNPEKNIVTWQIIINNPYSIPVSKWSGDKTVTDEMMSEAISFKVYGYNDDANAKTEITGVNHDGNTFVFDNNMATYKKYIIEYVTLKDPDKNVEKNIATFNNVPKEKTVNTAPREELTKNYLNGAEVDGNLIEIPWEVSLRYSQNVFGGQTYTDNMEGLFIRNGEAIEIKDSDDKEIELNHYITAEQLNAMEIWGKEPDGNLVKLTDTNGKYKATRGSDGKSFTIEFTNKEYWNKYSELKLVYKTTGEGMNYINNDSVPVGDNLTFRNDSEFKDNKTSKDYEITKKSAIQKYDLLANSDASNTTHMLTEFTGNTATLKWKLVVNESQNYGSDDINLTDYIPANLTVPDKFITSFKVNGQDKTGYTVEVKEKDNKGRTPVDIKIPYSVHGGKKVEIEYQVTIPKSELKKLCGATGISFENEVKDDKKNSVTQTQKVVDKLEDYSKTLVSPSFEFEKKENGNFEFYYEGDAKKAKLTDKNFKYLIDVNPYKKDLDKNSNTLKITDEMNGEHSGTWISPLNIKLLIDKVKVYEVRDDGSVRQLENSEYKFDYKTVDKISDDTTHGGEMSTSTNTMYFVIPDEMHIRIEYTYLIDDSDGYEIPDTENGIEVRNAFRFNNNLKWSTVNLQKVFFEESSASATAEIQPYIQIEKVEEGHYDVKLARAVFELERWDGKNWVPMTGKTRITKTDSNGEKVEYDQAVWGEDSKTAVQFATNSLGIYSLPLLGDGEDEEGTNGNTIYRLTEVSAPSGYYLDPNSTVHYFEGGTLPEDFVYPPDVSKNDLEKISNQKITITNAPRAIDVEKNWKNVSEDSVTPDIKVQLYRTTTQLIPSPKNAHIIVEVNYTDSTGTQTNEYKFDVDVENTQAPDIVIDGTYVSRLSVQEITDDSTIELTEQSGIFAKWEGESTYQTSLWNLKFIEQPMAGQTIKYTINLATAGESVEKESVYSVSVNNKHLTGDEMEYVLPEGTTGEPVYKDGEPWTATLNDDNYWRYSFTDNTADHSLLPESDNNGTPYHYFVKEVPVPEGYVASYVGNGTANGSIQVVNTYNPQNLTVKKKWDDKGHENARPSGIYVQLYKSTDKNATEFTDDDKVGDRRYILSTATGNWEAEWTEDTLRHMLETDYDKSKDSDQNPLTDDKGNPYYFFIKEEQIDNYYPTYPDEGVKKGVIEFKNTYINSITPPIKLEKKWSESNGTTPFDASDIASVQVEIWKTSKADPSTSGSDNSIPDSVDGNAIIVNSGVNFVNLTDVSKIKRVLVQVSEGDESIINVGFGESQYNSNYVTSDLKLINGKLEVNNNGALPAGYQMKDDIIVINPSEVDFKESSTACFMVGSWNGEHKVKYIIELKDGTRILSENVSSDGTFTTTGGNDTPVVTPSENPIPEGAVLVEKVSLTVNKLGEWYTLLDDLPAYETDGSEIFYYFKESKVIDKDGKDVTSKYTVTYDGNNGIGGVKESATPDEQQVVSLKNTVKPTGTLKVNKKWLDGEPDVKEIKFIVYSSTEERLTQPENPDGFGNANPEEEEEESNTPVASQSRINFTIKVGETEKLNKSFSVASGNVTFRAEAEWCIYQYDISSLVIGDKSYNVYSLPNGISVSQVDDNSNITLDINGDTNITLNLNDKNYGSFIRLLVNGTNVDDLINTPEPTPDPTPEPEPTPDIDLTLCNKYDPNIEGAKQVGTITVTKQGDTWSGELKDLPLTDDNGHKLYYYVVEQNDGSSNYIPVAYCGNGVRLDVAEPPTITVYNKKHESEGVTMPSTGGVGTRRYYIMGMSLMFISMFILKIRRKKKT